jgi:hypothetical protein
VLGQDAYSDGKQRVNLGGNAVTIPETLVLKAVVKTGSGRAFVAIVGNIKLAT